MKKVEDIEKEYESYKLKSDYVTSAEEFASFIEIGIDDLEEQISGIIEEVKENCKSERMAKIRNFFLGLFQIEEVDYYGEDNKILDEIIEFIMKYKTYFQRASEVVTQENFQELTKLVDFSCEYYNQHMDYYEGRRDTLEYSYKGICFSNNKVNEIAEFDEFFNKKVEQHTKDKTMEKNKKIW